MDVSRADISVKIWWNLPISNPKADLLNVNAYSKFGVNPLLFTQVIVRKQKYVHVLTGNSVKNWRNLPISNPKPDLHNINTYTKFGENPLMFTEVIRRIDGRTRGPTWNHNTPPHNSGGVKNADTDQTTP